MKKTAVMGLIAVPAVLLLGACDFFKSSGPAGGVSPFVSDLRLSRSAVPCDRPFTMNFGYSDAQNDIEFLRVTFQSESGSVFEVEVLWESGGGLVPPEDESILTEEELEELEELFGGDLDLSQEGRASYTYMFECDSGKPRGNYTVLVQLIDERGHESNTRSADISLTSD